jgi:hypothetical protein
VSNVVSVGICVRMGAAGDRGSDTVRGRVHDLDVAHGADRRAVASAHAGGAHDADPGPSLFGRFCRRCSAPAMAQESESHTRTVTAGGGVSPSFTTSKWA